MSSEESEGSCLICTISIKAVWGSPKESSAPEILKFKDEYFITRKIYYYHSMNLLYCRIYNSVFLYSLLAISSSVCPSPNDFFVYVKWQIPQICTTLKKYIKRPSLPPKNRGGTVKRAKVFTDHYPPYLSSRFWSCIQPDFMNR